ncbi:hypothetical protein Lal_00041659 [Lupinus albus]|nr:hypothetical protein Lal_00041659 [Lupinus albus]
MGTGRPQSIGRVVTMYGAEASESDSLIRCGMYCSKLDRRPNATPAEEARDHGQMVTPSGAETSGVDDPARGKRMVTGIPCLVHYFRLGRVDPNLCAAGGVDVYVLVSDCGKWCDIYRRFSLLVVIPVRYNFGDGLIIDMGSGVPHSLKFESVIGILKCNRLHSTGNRLHSAGNRLHSAGNRLHRIKSIRYVHLTQCNRLHISGNRLHIAGNRLHIAGNRLHIAGNRLHTPGNRLHSPGNRLHTSGNRLHTPGNRLHRIKSIRYAHFSRCNRLHHVGNRLQPDDTSLKQKPKHNLGGELRREEREESFSRARSLRTHLRA